MLDILLMDIASKREPVHNGGQPQAHFIIDEQSRGTRKTKCSREVLHSPPEDIRKRFLIIRVMIALLYSLASLLLSSRVADAIIGGEFSRDGEFPYAIKLFIKDAPFCTGVLVDAEYTLSTCHCVGVFNMGDFVAYEPDHVQLIGGDPWVTSMNSNKGVLQKRQCHQIIIHPNCTDMIWGWGFDFSLLKVNAPFHINPTVQPMELPYYNPETLNRVFEYYIRSRYGCYAIGWGKQVVVDRRINAKPSERLKAAFVKLITWPECLRTLCSVGPKNVCETVNPRYPGKACAVGMARSASCDMDDGGPIVCDGYVIALTSKGVDCGRYLKPRTIVRLDFALGFMRDIIMKNIRDGTYKTLKEPDFSKSLVIHP